MRISDMLGQYNRNVSSGTEELRSAQSTGKMVSTLGELGTGNIFEGTVNNVKNGRVTLSLSSGQMISARLDGKVNLNVGDSMFFQVRSNDGTTISIKPYTTESGISNPILLNALSAAGIPATDRSVAMVDAMMKEQMAIGKQSILEMVKVLNNNPNVNVPTLVQMTKIGLPVSVEMASQFENYMTNQHAILGEIEQAIGQMTHALSDESISPQDAFLLYSKMLDVLQGEKTDFGQDTSQGMSQTTEQISIQETKQDDLQRVAQGVQQNVEQQKIQDTSQGMSQNAQGIIQEIQTQQSNHMQGISEAFTADSSKKGENWGIEKGGISESFTADSGKLQMVEGAPERQLAAAPQTIEQLLDGKQVENLKQLLQNIPTLAGNTELFTITEPEDVFVNTMLDDEVDVKTATTLPEKTTQPMAEFNKNMTAAEFLDTIKNALLQNSAYGFAGVHKLFGSKEFQTLLKNRIEQQWMIKPGELKEENKINRLYERMEEQMKQMEQALKLAGVTQNSFSNTASEVRNNIEFMNQINQIYTYVQLPLKLTGQNASCDLYVYTNKKNLKDPDIELTAFLHLDLENLGSTDVSVKLLRKNVKTNFYMDNDASYDLVEKHLPVLEKRLKNKGYTCSLTVTNEERKVDFVGDFLQKDMPSAGTLHRYSFDMKA